MDKQSRRSLASPATTRSKRSRTATKEKSTRGGTKSRKSFGSKKSTGGGNYEKVNDADEVEMIDLGNFDVGPIGQVQMNNNAVLRPHEIYENTTYIPNN